MRMCLITVKHFLFQASLKEIKWKVFESANVTPSVGPNNPVISACSKLFHANRLVTWHLGRNGLQLWVFYWPSDRFEPSPINLLKGSYVYRFFLH